MRFGVGYEKHLDQRLPARWRIVGCHSRNRAFPGLRPGHATRWAASTRNPARRDIRGFVSADYSYTGDSISLLNGGSGLQATRPPYSLRESALRGAAWEIRDLAQLHNLTNAKPNLGDIGYVGYAQYNAAGTVIPQVATLQPFTVILQYKNNF